MNWIALVIIILATTLMGRMNSGWADGPPIKMDSLCVMGDDGVCYVAKDESLGAKPPKGFYCISPSDLDKILEKLKSTK